MTLRPLATSCAKDYKGHSLAQTSFIEPPYNYVVDRLYAALFSALEQTHSALVACDSERMTVAFIAFVNIHRSVVLSLQLSLVVTWLVPRETPAVREHILCTPYKYAPQFTVSLPATPHMQGACVFSCNPPPCTGIFYVLLR